MPKDKEGNYLTWKEFMQRWKKGIAEMTPLQQSRIIYHNTWLMLFGILAGAFFSLFNLRDLWWLTIILVAAFVNTVVVQIGNYQKYTIHRRIEKMKYDNKIIESGKEVKNE